jgi:hypothetical protein
MFPSNRMNGKLNPNPHPPSPPPVAALTVVCRLLLAFLSSLVQRKHLWLQWQLLAV